ncbi:Fur family transcriptional regulator [Demequina mangrovi]|uniref:Zinc uptake regulator, Fur family n=1 Tax=Demequina mangrovi TaxID=1043493 RepID=A0A1H6V0P0_9MICO|nr:Fur family transcriptional regulator [Demequina mangrovi]SEI95427.1 zinc uptake regulator, Fur family [Demequina mangrovi]
MTPTTPLPRMTRQRREILDVLDTRDFRSAQQWHERLRAEGSTVGLATVYRGLQALADQGEVDAVVSESGETLYRRCEAGEEHHHHLRCRVCGKAVEIDVPEFEDFAHRIAAQHSYVEISHTIELTGVCPDCAAADKG